MARLKTLPWDVTDYLQSDEDIVAYLEAALEERDDDFLAVALVDIARARGLQEALAKELRTTATQEATEKSPTRLRPAPAAPPARWRIFREPLAAGP